MSVRQNSAGSAQLGQLQLTAVGSGSLLIRYLDKNGDSLPGSSGNVYETLTVATDGFSVLPNLPGNAVGIRAKASGSVYQWGKKPDGTDLGDYEDAIAFGDVMPTDRYVNIGRVAE